MKPIRLTSAVVGVVVAATLSFAVAEDNTKKAAKATLDKPAPDFTLADLDGKKHTLSEYEGKFVVLEWNNMDCPFVKKHYSTGNMQGLQEKYTEKGVVWLTICSSGPGKQGHYSADDMKKKVAGSELHSSAYLLDPDGTVGKAYAAKTTPHMYVIDPKGVLVYAGAIDDKPSTKTADVKTADNYVKSCLDACLAGKGIEASSTTPYGCSVKYAD